MAIVTGASSGIGRAIANALAGAGAMAIINHPPKPSSQAKAREVVAEIEAAGGSAFAVAADVSKEDQVEAMFAEAVKRFGTIHIVIANAGIQRPAAIHDMTLADWQAVIDVNLTGAFLVARAATREFLRRGPVPAMSTAIGKIIFTSSVHEIIPWSFQANYAASKGGMGMLMQSLAQELAPLRIRINSVAPGAIQTSINHGAWQAEAARQDLLQLIPYGRVGVPEDIARAVTWLASDASDYVTARLWSLTAA